MPETGTVLLVVVPFPNSPTRFSPHERAEPGVTAAACTTPANTAPSEAGEAAALATAVRDDALATLGVAMEASTTIDIALTTTRPLPR